MIICRQKGYLLSTKVIVLSLPASDCQHGRNSKVLAALLRSGGKGRNSCLAVNLGPPPAHPYK